MGEVRSHEKAKVQLQTMVNQLQDSEKSLKSKLSTIKQD